MSCDGYMQELLDKPMPYIGLYISAASLICTLAIAADAFDGFRRKKLWFPCKWFGLSSTSLTLLAVAMKLPMDLSSNLSFKTDWLAKLSSLTLMSTAMANFISSLGSMDSKDILTNIAALGILVVTVSVNVWVQLKVLEDLFDPQYTLEGAVPTVFMLLLLVLLVSSAVAVPNIKRSLQVQFREMHKAAKEEDSAVTTDTRDGISAVDEQRRKMMKYWVMARTCSPQFVIARSVVSATASSICLIAVIVLARTCVRRLAQQYWPNGAEKSAYGNYTAWILIVQSIGVVIGTIAPTMRWLVVITLACSRPIRWDFFKIESYWVQTLIDYRDSFQDLQIQQGEATRKILHGVKWLILNFFIGSQISVIFISKLLIFVSALFVYPFFFCYNTTKKVVFRSKYTQSLDHGGSESELNLNHLNRYALVLEGEVELPRMILFNICKEGDDMIKKGKKNQPVNLTDLLRKSISFNGVLEFDNRIRVPSLHSQEPANSWTLPVVTLTGIAISIPNASEQRRKQLIKSVDQGLSLAKLVERTLNCNEELENVRKAADLTWASIFLHRKWQEIDLRKTYLESSSHSDVLEDLSARAKRTVVEFKKESKDFIMENPLNWPCKVIAANSMYRISSTISLSYTRKRTRGDELKLFEAISTMIADIFAACFTNLTRVITAKCCLNDIMKREKNVEEAFFLMGRTEQIRRLVQEHDEWPFVDNPQYIDEWRALFPQKNNENPSDDLEELSIVL